jgi:methionyl-tRNA synthetase
MVAKKASKKKTKKVRKSPPVRAIKKTAAKKSTRTVKKAKKTAKKAAKKPATKKAATKSARKPASKAKSKKVGSAPKQLAVAKTASAPTPAPADTPRAVAAATPAPASSRDNIYYITTAIAYPNGVPHIGHAYEAIATDALARFQRLDGKDVFFLTGTDEHGLKMVQTAELEKLPTVEVATRNALRFKQMDERLNVSFDRFIRTTEEQHHRASQAIWQRMADHGDIYLDTYAGWYSVRDEAYYAEDETTLGPDNVRFGPQGTPVEWVEEKSYFFRLSAYQNKLLTLYERHPDFIGPDSRKNEVVSFVKSGLRDLSISRTTFDWGVRYLANPTM